MRKIPLTQGQFALVADQHYEDLMQFKWHAQWNCGTRSFYASRKFGPHGKQTTEFMHRRILGLKPGDRRQGDHVSHDTLDNRPTNLRIVTNYGNGANRRDQSKWGVGVVFDSTPRRKFKPFVAQVSFDGKRCYIGRFATAKEARLARKIWMQERDLS